MEDLKLTSLLGLTLQELTALTEEHGQPAYRGRQVFESLYRHRNSSLEEISSLPKAYRGQLLEEGLGIGLPRVQARFESIDGTIRYLIGMSDGQTVETVFMPEGDGGEEGDNYGYEAEDSSFRAWDRATICVSSQVGCAVDCQFCLTAQLKMKRNLTAGEIVGQVIAVLNDRKVAPPQDRVNLVFMGMGEPFLNYDNFIKAVRLLAEGVGVPQSRMTVSTAGIVPRVYDLGAEAIRPKLAISLNASNDDLRSRLMPINRKWNLDSLIAAARAFPLRNREKLTFEYVLLHEVNDSTANAREIVEMIRGLRAKVNLIALNPGPGIAYSTPNQTRVGEFQNILRSAGIPAYLRKPRGRDIFAACGQLKRTVEITPAG